MPRPLQTKLLSLVPLALQTVATVEFESQDDALGIQLTHPSPSLHSARQVVTLEKPPCPSQTLATLPSHTVCWYAQTGPASLIGGMLPPAPPVPGGELDVRSLDAQAPNNKAKNKQQGQLLSSMAVSGRYDRRRIGRQDLSCHVWLLVAITCGALSPQRSCPDAVLGRRPIPGKVPKALGEST